MAYVNSNNSGNDTYACDTSDCQISCASPQFGPNVCYSMQQNFLDGTPCGGGGKCSNGVCQGSTVGGEILSWIDQNKTLVIALSASLGGLIVLSILACIIKCCIRRRHPKIVPTRTPRGWGGIPYGRGNSSDNHQWGSFVPQPPPLRNTDKWGDNPQMWRQPTIRYA
jgi:hypothetical protein